jgi:hypothetical protein
MIALPKHPDMPQSGRTRPQGLDPTIEGILRGMASATLVSCRLPSQGSVPHLAHSANAA